jgi:hypothetical protein
MPRAKKEMGVPTPASPNAGEHAGGPAPAGMPASKMAAVRKALQVLGKKAKPGEIQRYLRTEYGMEIERNHASSYKSTILGGRSRNRPRERAPAAPRDARPDGAGGPAAFEKPADLKDYKKYAQTVRQLAEKIGVDKLRDLVDLLYS